jgi:hypothetical protein
MLKAMMTMVVLGAGILGQGENAMAGTRIVIASAWGSVAAELEDNAAARGLVAQLPLTIDMSDHLRQEKTGMLPGHLPKTPRQRAFSKGLLGLWSAWDFVIYYRDGTVPSPGIVPLGRVTGDVSIFDRPGPVTVTITQATD